MKSKKAALYGLMIALSMVMSYVEIILPFSFAVPGVKAGLANVVTVFALYKMTAKDAFAISIIRVLLTAVLFGNIYSFAYSASGAVLSFAVMLIMKKRGKFSEIGVSVAGGVSHNLGQILVAVAVFETSKLMYYFPILCLSGTVAGIFVGIAAGIIIKRIKV